MAETIECFECKCRIEKEHGFCPSCGKEIIDEYKELIEYYFSRGYKYKSIAALLSKNHGINICERTLKSQLHEYGLRRRLSSYDITRVRRRITEELNGPGCMGGYRSVWHTLSMEGYQVPRYVVEELVKELDPEGCALRKTKRLRRRNYVNPGVTGIRTRLVQREITQFISKKKFKI